MPLRLPVGVAFCQQHFVSDGLIRKLVGLDNWPLCFVFNTQKIINRPVGAGAVLVTPL